MRGGPVDGTTALPESTGRKHIFKETIVYAYGYGSAEPVKLTVLKHGDCCGGKEDDGRENQT